MMVMKKIMRWNRVAGQDKLGEQRRRVYSDNDDL